MKALAFSTLTLLFLSQASFAASLFSEPLDGDLGDSYSTPLYLGSLGEGSNTISGSVSDSDHWDTLTFTVDDGYRLESINITDYSSTAGNHVGLCISAAPYSGSCIEYINFNTPFIGLDLLQFDSAPGPQAAGEYFFGITHVNTDNLADFDTYAIDFVVTAVPVPAAVWLFASGLLSLIGFSQVRRRG